jgi:catechol 2,3-dioxygenase-like lactoylglutathione lyase family enzyme
MALFLDWIAIDCRDAAALAAFWADALDYRVLEDEDPTEVLIVPREGSGPRFILLQVPEEKSVKNRLHLDLRPDDQAAEVSRLLDMGATKADVGQGEVSWVVLQDPEGNEFCILRALDDDDRAEREELGIT